MMKVKRIMAGKSLHSVVLTLYFGLIVNNLAVAEAIQFEPWKQGYLDIHHLSVNGNAAFFVFPDGTTMLFDAGVTIKEKFEKRVPPLKAAAQRPNASKRPGQWYSEYIRDVMPRDAAKSIDYAVISHFHGDHYGVLTGASPDSSKGPYKLTGVTDVHETLEIRTLIDRAFPFYSYPVDVRKFSSKRNNRSLQNYFDFVDYRTRSNQVTESLIAGSNRQIRLRYAPEQYQSFEVRNLKVNGTIWTGIEEQTQELFRAEDVVGKSGSYNENLLSLALKVSYGDFDYFTGGDNTGLSGPDVPAWFDVETPMAAVIGETDVVTLNHHGVRDATNANFVKGLQPRVFVIQSITSDHPGQEVFYRMNSQGLYQGERDVFATYIHEETKVTYGPWFVKALKSSRGHIVFRVAPGGASYEIFVLDDTAPGINPIAHYGPYQSKQ